MIEIRVGTIAEMREKALELLDEHYAELTLNKEVVVLNVDWERYFYLEKAGVTRVVVAEDAGAIIGYSVFFLHPHIHYKTLNVASNDVLFLRKKYRTSSTAGLRLLKFSEQYLKSIGVSKMTYHIKDSNDFSPILKRMGFLREEIIMGKLIGDSHGI